MELRFELKGQTLTRKDKCTPIANSQGYLKAYFKIPNEVSGTLMAHFKMMRANKMVEETIKIVNCMCSVPDSLVKVGTLHIWLSISTSKAYIPTNCVPISIGESGDTGTVLPLPDRTVNQYDDITRMYKEILEHSSGSGNDNTAIEQLKDSVEKSFNAVLARLKALEDKAQADPTNPDQPPITSTVSVMNYGADATGVNYSTTAFKSALSYAKSVGKKVHVPSGTFKLKWLGSDGIEATDEIEPNLLRESFEGVGNIVIDSFPQPYTANICPTYENAFGKFNMTDVQNEIITSMNLTHECRQLLYNNMFHAFYSGTKSKRSFDNNYPIWNCWGAIGLRLDKMGAEYKPTASKPIKLCIGKMGIMMRKNGVWSVHPNPYCESGGFWVTATGNNTTNVISRKAYDDHVEYTLDLKSYYDNYDALLASGAAQPEHGALHFWCPQWNIGVPTGYDYAVAFLEVWIDSTTPNMDDYLFAVCGIDMITTGQAHSEFANGRMRKLTYDRKWCHAHNVKSVDIDSALKTVDLKEMINDANVTIWS